MKPRNAAQWSTAGDSHENSAVRTFISVPIPVAVQKQARLMQGRLQAAGGDVKWVDPSQIHITLKFLGDVDFTPPGKLREAVAAAIHDEPPFSLRLSGLGTFPLAGVPRVIWAAIDGDLHRLLSLQKKVETAVVEQGFPPEERPFSPHVTLGRVRSPRNTAQLKELLKGMESTELGQFAVTEVRVMKSQLAPSGPHYTILHSAGLPVPQSS